MPNAYITKISKEKGISIEKVEKYWKKAKELAGKEDRGEDYAYITGIFKKMVGENLTFDEMQMFQESKFETSFFMPTIMKKILEKVLKSKELKAAIKQYITFKEKGEADGVALHKAAGMYGFASDRLFADIIRELEAKGLLGEQSELSRRFLAVLEDKSVVDVETFLEGLVEEGEPTNTSTGVAPDRDHKGKKSTMKRKKDCDEKENCDTMNECGKGKMKEGFTALLSRIEEATGMRMKAPEKRKASAKIAKKARENYFPSVGEPIAFADDALRAVGYRLVQEDGTDYSAIFTGAEGNTFIRIAPVNAPDTPASFVVNTGLAVSWYKMPSGKWEVNMYLS